MTDTKVDKISDEERLLAAMAYGEASASNDANELKALASVLVRQRDARGYTTMKEFIDGEPSYSYVVGDGNAKYKKLNKAKDEDISNDTGMSNALTAAKNALSDGPDLSNGAYFWDGADIKSNYNKHFKVRHGIKFTDPSHNIYDIKDSTKIVILYKIVKVKKTVKGKVKVTKEKVEVGRYDHVYDSTAAYGGTIFWKNNDDYITLSKGKLYK
ncbi:hypothetical protein OUI59_15935 [Klebsiella variicola subsp. tropica]|uniref:hypothetical protein n=1 Tax=Klebsiella variicola TaxID=244366 RepID=UPI0022838496|nr:hypothetical protein [Klebsiella variicola]WAL50333.1 hypothetical protein OUI59_15935 [Klebsiella variicola subsp. tropica]